MITSSNAGVTNAEPTGSCSPMYLWLSASVGALGGLLFGYDWVVIGGAKPFYEIYFQLVTPALQGWAMSCALIGCLAGAVISGSLSQRFGRKRLLTASALGFAISSLGTGLAVSFDAFVVWRILGGCAIGLASSIAPMYIAEISPAQIRGKLVSLNQMAIVVGILLAQVINWLIARPVPPGASTLAILASWNGQWGWRWMFGVTAIPSLLFLVATLFVPESPRWLAAKERGTQAFQVLARLGGAAYAQRVLEDLSRTATPGPSRSLFRELALPGVVRALLLGIALVILQQWCGINVIFNYAQEIFAAAGYQISGILFNIVVTGAVNLVFTVLALITIDRYGRRPLLLAGCTGLTLTYAILGFCYWMHVHGAFMLLLVLAAIACYALSLAPVIWVVIAEIFPNRIRGAAMSAAVTVLWGACFVLTYTFPLLNASLGASGTFWIFAAICLAGLLFVFRALPETRGQTLEEIERTLHAG